MGHIQRIASGSLGKASQRVSVDREFDVYTLSDSNKGRVIRSSNALSPIFDAFTSYIQKNCIGNKISHGLDLMPMQENDLKIRHQLWEDGDRQTYLSLEDTYLARMRDMFKKVNLLIEEINTNNEPIIILTINRKLKASKYIYCESEEIIDIVMAIYLRKLKNLSFYLIIQDPKVKNEEIKITNITRSHNLIPVTDNKPMYGVFDSVSMRNSKIQIYAINPNTGHRNAFTFKLDNESTTDISLLSKCFNFDLEDRIKQRDVQERNCYQFNLGQKISPLNKGELNSSRKHLFDISTSDQKIYLEQLRLDF